MGLVLYHKNCLSNEVYTRVYTNYALAPILHHILERVEVVAGARQEAVEKKEVKQGWAG